MPDAGRVVDYNRFAYARANPLRYVDPSGHVPYAFTIRSFAPFEWFGLGFHGDDRGYSSAEGASSRVHQRIVLDTDINQLEESSWSDPTYNQIAPDWRFTGVPESQTSDFVTNHVGNVRGFSFRSHYAGPNPHPFTLGISPPIDVSASIVLVENKDAQMLSISGRLTGDNFPATEAMISDPSGQSVFLGIGHYKGTPYTSLWGNKNRPITEFNLHIATDSDGNFVNVFAGGKQYSINDWNQQFIDSDPHKNGG